ncbi:MAG: hypothetical protein CM1200mP13_05290 [Candidatus Pelagibacterales bacterium]|nr:MAG: hypothetical protein CM1200mP13_05290 [Pelagibacterales bacterium]
MPFSPVNKITLGSLFDSNNLEDQKSILLKQITLMNLVDPKYHFYFFLTFLYFIFLKTICSIFFF